jgi:hypothetical protein
LEYTAASCANDFFVLFSDLRDLYTNYSADRTEELVI